jgi:hypothetical protein
LNAIFDVFGDETKYASVIVQTQMATHLQSVVSIIDQQLREQRQTLDKETVGHIKEAKLNLVRFIKYIK